MSRATTMKLSPLARPQRALMSGMGKLQPLVSPLFGRRTRVNADGERLAPEMAAVGWSAAHIPGMGLGGPEVEPSRRGVDEGAAGLAEKFPPFAVEEDLVIDSPSGPIPATRYRAREESSGLLVFFHGGGFVLGSRISHDGLVRRLALGADVDVLSVDYRLAPEHPFPAAVEDAVAAWRFAVEAAPRWGRSPNRIVVGGDSAGGNLSAVVAQQVRGDGVTPCLQLLLYPITDLGNVRPSRREFESGLFLTEERLEWFNNHYVPEPAMLTDPRCSPLLAEDLSGLAPAHVVVAGFDPLRDEGLEYAQRLVDAGVPVTVQREGAMIHAFANMTLISAGARAAVDRVNEAVREAIEKVQPED
ncbi:MULTISPECIES: alpha/beta hydrolase [unclassified Gordonia (in: high G+C Gram-positive bacteria)]|uniref:alpha/beta hydrolase n=1 Tax=unclassified Gordonia (in: high G+C Gram-positive bacteria) TaxID=2657482 RepID=UPI001F11759E|nr:alpha/beta hydrolase [Gordonia sp. ABSL49_1]MCH5641774.1 alpha/beta hydrolase [Gordonia sp. ABSL49_1]